MVSSMPRAQVKELVVVELADRRAVRVFDVVGVDFELWLGVDFGVAREQQIVVGLPGVGLLRAGTDDDFAVENRARVAVEHAAIGLAAGSVGLSVVDPRMVVDVLATAGQIEAVEGRVAAGRRKGRRQVVARKLRAEAHRVRREAAVTRLLGMDSGDMERLQLFLLQLVVLDCSVGAGEDLRHGVGQIRRAVANGIVLDHRRLRAVFGDDQVARGNHRPRRAGLGGDEQQLDRLLDDGAVRQVQVGAIGHEGGVERAEERLAIRVGKIRFEHFGRTFERRAGGQPPGR